MKWRPVPYVASAIVGLLCIPITQPRADASSDLDDAAARLQYAYFTNDARALDEAVALIVAIDDAALPPGITHYYAAYGRWKLAEIQAAGKVSPGKSAQECVRHARAARTEDVRMAEAFALEAVCSGYGSTLLPSGCSQKPLRTAEELDPRNPRIDLIALLCADKAERAGTGYGQKLRGLVESFEAAPPSRPGKPDWGHAEALVMLGEDYLQRGDALAARDTIERALVVAPDYRKAQELLRAAASRPK